VIEIIQFIFVCILFFFLFFLVLFIIPVNKEMRTTNQNVRTAQNRVNRHPTSESKRAQLDNAKSNAQQVRAKQIGTQMLNSTIGQINSNIVTDSNKRNIKTWFNNRLE